MYEYKFVKIINFTYHTVIITLIEEFLVYCLKKHKIFKTKYENNFLNP